MVINTSLKHDKNEQEAELRFSYNFVKQVYISNPFGENVKALHVSKGRCRFSIPGKRLITLKAVFRKQNLTVYLSKELYK